MCIRDRYLVHTLRRKTARKVLFGLQTHACLCRSATVEVHAINTPSVDSLHQFKSNNKPFDACYIRDEERRRINLDDYCCLLERSGNNEREVTFDEFKRRQELESVLDFAEDLPDSETSNSDSEAELIRQQ